MNNTVTLLLTVTGLPFGPGAAELPLRRSGVEPHSTGLGGLHGTKLTVSARGYLVVTQIHKDWVSIEVSLKKTKDETETLPRIWESASMRRHGAR